MRLTDAQVVDLCQMIEERYDGDIAHAVTVEILKNRTNENIRNWTSWTRRAAYRIWHKQKQLESWIGFAEDIPEEELEKFIQLDARLPESYDAKDQLAELMKTKEGEKAIKMLAGVTPVKSPQSLWNRVSELRKLLA